MCGYATFRSNLLRVVWMLAVFPEVLTLYLWCQKTEAAIGNDFSKGSNTTRHPVRWVIETDWGKKRWGVAFHPPNGGFLLLDTFVTLGYLFWLLLSLGINPTTLVFGALTGLSAQFAFFLSCHSFKEHTRSQRSELSRGPSLLQFVT